jgi:hypothetical protein
MSQEGKYRKGMGGFMTISGIETPFSRLTICLAGAIALILATGASSKASVRKAVPAKVYATSLTPANLTPQQKPVKLRYFGGPKSLMSAE